MLRWDDGTYSGPWRAKNITEIRTVVEFLASLAQQRKLIVAMEPTGTYGDPLRYALTQAGLNVHRVPGKAAHDYAEIFDGVPSQHDCKDAGVVADLAALGKSSPWPYPNFPRTRRESTSSRILWGTGKEGFDANHYAMDGGLAAMQSRVRFGRVVQTFRLGGG
jgi:hypothetical protein